MTEVNEVEPVRLADAERVVFERLSEVEGSIADPRLARTYLRVLALGRTGDAIDGVLAAHLLRDLVPALMRVAGVGPVRGFTDYEAHAAAISEAWPAIDQAGQPPMRAVARVRAMLEDHVAASNRARTGVDALLRGLDPAGAEPVPDASVTRWLDLTRRGSGIAHGIKEADRPLPESIAVRRLVDELTAALFAALAPWFVTIGEVDRLLALDEPSADDASAVLRLLSTASQVRYFYDRADRRWLRRMALADRGLTHPPGLVQTDEGWLAPDWPQGRFLIRIAADEADEVARLAARIAASDNPRVLHVLVELARALPRNAAASLVPALCRRLDSTAGTDYAIVDITKLVRELVEDGRIQPAAQLFIAAARRTASTTGERSWHLEQLMADLEGVASEVETVGRGLWNLLDAALRTDVGRRRYSTIWLKDIDRRPEFGLDTVWLFANGLYRLLLAGPLDASAVFTSRLLAKRDAVARRIALAAIADREDLLSDPDPLLGNAGRWDDSSSTRYEFRRALGSAWSRASDAARTALLAYAAEVAEAQLISERMADAGVPEPIDQVARDWRARFLHKISDRLPPEWLEIYGPLAPIAEERIPGIAVGWRGERSPTEAQELAVLDAAEVMAILTTWTEPPDRSFDGPPLEGLAAAAGEVVPPRLSEFAPLVDQIVSLRPQILAAITGRVERALREGRIEDPGLAVRFALDIGERMSGDADDEWRGEVPRNVAGMIELGANKEAIAADQFPRARAILQGMLETEPTGGWNDRGVSDDWDAGMVALNTLRGDVATALLELMFEARRLGATDEFDVVSGLLRHALSHEDGAIPVRAAIGLRLPWLLGNDPARAHEWADLLLGSEVPDLQREACWQAYLLYSRVFRDTVALIAGAYDRALSKLPVDESRERRPRDEREQLGIHVAWAHLMGMPQESENAWLETFFARAHDEVRARVARWIAEQGASANADEGVHQRARDFLRARVARGDADADPQELQAMSWIAQAQDGAKQVLAEIVLPALVKMRGRTQNESGVAELAARMAATEPRLASEALRLLVEGDRWRSLPHVAGDSLRRALETVIMSDDPEARRAADTAIHTLGAQGFLEYRAILRAPAEEGPGDAN